MIGRCWNGHPPGNGRNFICKSKVIPGLEAIVYFSEIDGCWKFLVQDWAKHSPKTPPGFRHYPVGEALGRWQCLYEAGQVLSQCEKE